MRRVTSYASASLTLLAVALVFGSQARADYITSQDFASSIAPNWILESVSVSFSAPQDGFSYIYGDTSGEDNSEQPEGLSFLGRLRRIFTSACPQSVRTRSGLGGRGSRSVTDNGDQDSLFHAAMSGSPRLVAAFASRQQLIAAAPYISSIFHPPRVAT